MPPRFGVVDLFAGPGGLGEGFASLVINGRRPFKIGISVEKETSAHQTLRLRAFLREFRERNGYLPSEYVAYHAQESPEPDWAHVDATAWQQACNEAQALELGTTAAATRVDDAIEQMKTAYDDCVLIGGPPCQAYSLVGRVRSRGKLGYIPEEDTRHYLFREYIRVLGKLRPAVFVMENVKGMLSSTVESRLVFEMLMEDLTSIGVNDGCRYELYAIRRENGAAKLELPRQPSDFVVRAESFGVPQRRHRVIIIGIRTDLTGNAQRAEIAVTSEAATVYDAIGSLPRLRSGISREPDNSGTWWREITTIAERLAAISARSGDHEMQNCFEQIAQIPPGWGPELREDTTLPETYGKSSNTLPEWLESPELSTIAQHHTRGHMKSDLGRYLFAAVFGTVKKYSPKAAQFPIELSPDHRNWNSGIFNDRFRVQLATESSTTVTSHIAKDGHNFIHYDPIQCRSLTVREAARLQTFPDDYLFLGNRTQQYVQVGNAVPPFLARQIAKLILKILE